MRQLNRTEIQALENGQQVHVRLSRAGRDQWEPEYEGRVTLYVQRFNGTAVTITPREYGWAEADPRRDIEADGSVIVEDYMMEIFTDA